MTVPVVPSVPPHRMIIELENLTFETAGTVSDLLSDIRAAENYIAYYENQIRQNHIAIAQILNRFRSDSSEVGQQMPVRLAPPDAPGEPSDKPRRNLMQMMEVAIKEMPAVFWYPDLLAYLTFRHPTVDPASFKRYMRIYIGRFIRAGVLKKVPGGLSRTS